MTTLLIALFTSIIAEVYLKRRARKLCPVRLSPKWNEYDLMTLSFFSERLGSGIALLHAITTILGNILVLLIICRVF